MITTQNLIKTYTTGTIETPVLKGLNFQIEKGQFVSIIGASGSGKSTLLYQLSLLDHPTSGAVILDGQDTGKMSSSQRTSYRLKNLGYVFQDYALLPELTAEENVALPLLMQGYSKKSAYKQAEYVLTLVGLEARLNNLPSQLSGGQQQRVSIARAIASKPKILFADEPTANLDNATSKEILSVFRDLHKEGQTIVMVTHEEEFAHQSQRVIELLDGEIIKDKRN